MKNVNDVLFNPAVIASLRGFGDPYGQALFEGAKAHEEQRVHQAQAAKYQAEMQETARKALQEKMLPDALRGVDFKNPDLAFRQLTEKGANPEYALTLISKMSDIDDNKQGMGIRREELGLKRQSLGLDQAKFGLESQKIMRELSMLQSGQLAPEEAMKVEKELRSEIKKPAEIYSNIKDAYSNIKGLSKHSTGAGDMGMVYSYIKLLDPTSTVREGEAATAQNAGGLSEQARAKVNDLLGRGSLTEKQRQELIQSSKTLYGNQAKSYKKQADQIKNLAKEYKVNPMHVILNEPEEITEDEEFVDFNGQRFTESELEAIARGGK